MSHGFKKKKKKKSNGFSICHQWDVEVVFTCNMSLTKCLLWLAEN